jgi:hypothetical protein
MRGLMLITKELSSLYYRNEREHLKTQMETMEKSQSPSVESIEEGVLAPYQKMPLK